MDRNYKVTVYLDEQMFKWLNAASDTEGVSVSEFTRRILRREEFLWRTPKSPDSCTLEEYELVRALRGLLEYR